MGILSERVQGSSLDLSTLASLDFVALYDKIPLAPLVDALSKLTRDAFGTRSFIVWHGPGHAYWSNVPHDSAMNITCTQMIEMFTLSLLNSYNLTGKTLRKQIRGCGMGLAFIPQAAGLYLFFIERTALRSSQLFRDVVIVRYIGDVLAIGLRDAYEVLAPFYGLPSTSDLPKIHPHTGFLRLAFLDLMIQVDLSTNVVHVETYDKRRDYPFEVRKNPRTDSLIHFDTLRRTVISQLVRFARTNSAGHSFATNASILFNYMRKDGTPLHLIREALRIFERNHLDLYPHISADHFRSLRPR